MQAGIAKHCPGMIIQFSTGGRGRLAEERGASVSLKPDMASLATGSVNFATIIYENPPQMVESLAKDMLVNDVKPEVEIFDLVRRSTGRAPPAPSAGTTTAPPGSSSAAACHSRIAGWFRTVSRQAAATGGKSTL